MHNITNRADALSYLSNLYSCYRDFQDMAYSTSGGVREAWEGKASKARNVMRAAIFLIRENDFEGAWEY